MKEITDLIYSLHHQNEKRFRALETKVEHTNKIATDAARGVYELNATINTMTESLRGLANQRLEVTENLLEETKWQSTKLVDIDKNATGTNRASKWGMILGTVAATAAASFINELVQAILHSHG